MKKLLKVLSIGMPLFAFDLAAKSVTVYRCCSPFNLCDLTNFKHEGDCMNACGGANRCEAVDIDEEYL